MRQECLQLVWFAFFVYLNRKDQLNIRVLLLARSEQKVQDLFGELTGEFECFYQDVCQPIEFDDEVDFVIHAASNASHIISNTILLGLFRPTLLEP